MMTEELELSDTERGVLDAHRRELTLRQTSAELGISERSVERARRRLADQGLLELREPLRPYTPEELDFALYLLEDGAPYTEVAETLGRHARSLSKKLPGYGQTRSETSMVAKARTKFEWWLRDRGLADD